jgi:hypothetical protein
MMDESLLGVVLLVSVACVASIVCHYFIKEYWLANIVESMGSDSID